MPNNLLNIDLDPVSTAEGLDLVIEILSVNGEMDTYTYRNSVSAQVRPSTTNLVEFNLRTDFWPEEIGWELRDGSGALIDSDASYPELTCDADFNATFNLNLNECYQFTITDSFGDGLFFGAANPAAHSCNTPGGRASNSTASVSLGSEQGIIFDDIAYGSGATIAFTVTEEVVSVQEITALEGMQLFPNPVTDLLSVRFDLKEATKLDFQVFNTVGQQVQHITTETFGSGRQQLEVDATQLQSGVYFLRVQDGEQITTRRFMVQH